MNRAGGGETEFWRSGWFWALLALASTLPMLVPPLQMMPDYFSHTGRYHVMNHGAESAFLPHYYRFQWRLIGNLGVDLLMVPLGHWLPTETAARICAASIPPLTVAGVHAVSTASWGRVQAPALLALPFIYSFTMLYGFVNYQLGLALALLVLALWIRSADGPAWRRLAVMLPLGLLVWVVHMAAWAVLLAAVGCWELARARQERPGVLATLRRAIRRCLPLAVPLLIILWESRGGVPAQAYSWQHKGEWLTVFMIADSPTMAMAEVLTLGLAAGLAVTVRGVRGNPGLGLAAAALALLFLALPNAMLGSFYADARLLAPMVMLGVLGIALPASERATVVAWLGILVFGIRTAEITQGWTQRGTAAMIDLAGLEKLPLGARIAVVLGPDACRRFPLTSLSELPSLAIVRRDAFVNSEWDLAGQQLMQPVWNLGHGYNDQRSVVQCSRTQPLAATLARLPRDRFGYVWVFGHAQLAVPWLRIVHQGPNSRLYAIAGPPA